MKAIINNQLLILAKKLCKQRKVRMTPQRFQVLRLMSQQNSSIRAYDLLDLLRQSEPQAKPPTIYRALKFLLEQRFIHYVKSTNSFILCHYFDTPLHTSVFFICKQCRLITEHTIKDIENILNNTAAIVGFSISNIIIESNGFCLQCTII